MSMGWVLIDRVRAAAERSEFLKTVAQCQGEDSLSFALGDVYVRSLTDEEIARLRQQGNWADDWSNLRVADGFQPDRVHHCSFHGDVVMGRFDEFTTVDGARLPTGLWNSTICDCILGSEVLVRDVRCLSWYVVGSGAVLMNCGYIGCEGRTRFGNGIELRLGVETGGREVAVFADIDFEVAAEMTTSRSDTEMLRQYSAAVAKYSARAESSRGIIAGGVRLRNSTKVRNTFVGACAEFDGAELVDECTLLSSQDEPVQVASGACLTQSIAHWGSHASKMALVDRCVLLEHSHVERQGKVFESILAPNTGVAKGEVSACLLGPFVGFHHQALLISAIWPGGKGNVAYGANVGSNHTAKLPDQEIWPGEAMFFGLGVNVKFPADFRRAPFSIIASSVDTLPQKVTFPFSLINNRSAAFPDIPPALNEIIPAWLLTDNIYFVKRNEHKYKTRNQARRTKLAYEAFRPDTIDLMLDACQRLEAVTAVQATYTEKEIAGLGKNFMTEQHRQPAIDAYRFYMKCYALLGLWSAVERAAAEGGDSSLAEFWTAPGDQRWEHQRRLLRSMFGITDVYHALDELPQMLERIARDVERSKAKDDRRGVRIIDDYDQVHPPSSEDIFVIQFWEETRRQIYRVEKLLARIKGIAAAGRRAAT